MCPVFISNRSFDKASLKLSIQTTFEHLNADVQAMPHTNNNDSYYLIGRQRTLTHIKNVEFAGRRDPNA